MSSLTPTSPELPQTSRIPSGYFVELPDFATKVQELVDFFNPDEKEKLSQDQNKIQKQKIHLTTLIEELTLSQKDYDFFDYEDRLLLSDSEIENILETQIFRKKDGEFTELGKSFFEYLELLTEGKSEELKRKMKKKLIKELKLEDRVYEKIEGIAVRISGYKYIHFENKEQFFQDIKQAGKSGIGSLDLGCQGLSKKLEASDFLELVKQAGESGIRSLNLRSNYLSKKLEASDFLELVKQAGESGIQSLNLRSNYLSAKLEVSDFLSLVKQAGLSGIKSLNLWNNNLSKKLEATDFIELVKQAGRSGLKSLDLLLNNLSEKLEASDFIELVKQAGESGIRSLDLGGNGLSDKLETSDFLSLVKQAGESGIRSLDLGENGFSEKLNNFQKKEIDNFTKQYNMQLNYLH